jgi:thiol:disulfide interchange protein DsbA
MSLPGVLLRVMLGATLLWVAAVGAAPAGDDFFPGVDYEVLPQPVPTDAPEGKVEVAEIFWYGCPHCYRFEPYLEKWRARAPETAHFVRIPAALNPGWTIHARLYYALQLMGELDRLHPLIFKAIHEQGRSLRNQRAIERFLEANGVDVAAFRKAFDSLEVQTWMREGRDRVQRYGIRGVPAVVVAGKYKTSGSLAGSYERMIAVIDHLVAMESARGAKPDGE